MPDRAFTVKPMERSLPWRDWRWTRSQSILIAMEVFSWRSGPVGFGRTENRPLQRNKTSSRDPELSRLSSSSPLPVNLYRTWWCPTVTISPTTPGAWSNWDLAAACTRSDTRLLAWLKSWDR